MNFTSNLIINIYSILLLIIVNIQSLKQSDKDSLQQKLYMMMLHFTLLMLIVDVFSRFDGNPGTIYSVFNNLGNFLIYLLSPIIPSLWLLYTHNQVYHEDKKTRRWLYPLLAINAANLLILV